MMTDAILVLFNSNEIVELTNNINVTAKEQ